MATTTPDSLERVDFGPVEVREATLDGYTVNVPAHQAARGHVRHAARAARRRLPVSRTGAW